MASLTYLTVHYKEKELKKKKTVYKHCTPDGKCVSHTGIDLQF